MSAIQAPKRVLISVLSTYERSGWHHPSITMFVHSLRFNNDYATAYCPINNFVPAASGRNFLGRQFVDSEAEWLLMIDNDMDVPLNLLDTLKDVPDDAGIVVPQFYLWDQSKARIGLCWGMEINGKDTHALPDGTEIHKGNLEGWHELTKCGTGVIFIRREVFEKIRFPWFKYVVNDDGGFDGTEDIYFCKKALDAGIKIYGNASIQVGHFHSVNLLTLANKYIPVDKLEMLGVKPVQDSSHLAESEPAMVSPT